MTIRATFTGANSLGYKTGKEYELRLSDRHSFFDWKSFSISRIDGSGKCPYESIYSFLKNWDNIQVVSI